jgi:hypothetical protein
MRRGQLSLHPSAGEAELRQAVREYLRAEAKVATLPPAPGKWSALALLDEVAEAKARLVAEACRFVGERPPSDPTPGAA